MEVSEARREKMGKKCMVSHMGLIARMSRETGKAIAEEEEVAKVAKVVKVAK